MDLLPGLSRDRRATPYMYTEAEIAALMAAARTMRNPLMAATYETLVGLIAVTGMRVGEVMGLDRNDVDWTRGVLTVRHGKFNKSREIPLHPSTLEALRAFARLRDQRCPHPQTPSFFASATGARLSHGAVQGQFRRLVGNAGLQPRSSRCRPRIHDLRHRFAVDTLERWYRSGVDVAPRLPLLSTYLGHVQPRHTYWYLSAKPELLALAAERLEISLGALP